MNELTVLIKQDMKPALGVTEPGAIAYAVATAKSYIQGNICSIKVLLNSAMYKNAFTCGIPNSDKMGNYYAAALGAVAGDAKRGLEALAEVTKDDNTKAEEMVKAGKVDIQLDHMGFEIDIKAIVSSAEDRCEVHITESHTHIKQILLNDKIIQKEDSINDYKSEEKVDIHMYSVKGIMEYVTQVPVEELLFIKEAYIMNMELFEEGIESDKTVFVHQLFQENGRELISRDPLKTAQLICTGAIEARVLGLDKPAMSITGSGAHGIIATLPLFAYYRINKESVNEEELLRATALSYLITMYIKEHSGKLSAFCGCAIAAGTGMASGLTYLRGGRIEAVTKAIQNMAAGITGMICDGGNQGCVMKGIVAVDAAFRAVDMAMAEIGISPLHGILGKTPELTMNYMGQIASPGMVGTEAVIVSILKEKGNKDER